MRDINLEAIRVFWVESSWYGCVCEFFFTVITFYLSQVKYMEDGGCHVFKLFVIYVSHS